MSWLASVWKSDTKAGQHKWQYHMLRKNNYDKFHPLINGIFESAYNVTLSNDWSTFYDAIVHLHEIYHIKFESEVCHSKLYLLFDCTLNLIDPNVSVWYVLQMGKSQENAYLMFIRILIQQVQILQESATWHLISK